MNITLESRDRLADEVIWKKRKLTYAEVHACGWTSEDNCRRYVYDRWCGSIGQRGVTIRTKKLWTSAVGGLRVSGEIEVEGSLWKVEWSTHDAIQAEIVPKVTNRRHYNGHIFDAPDVLSLLGYVVAPDVVRAKMAAMVTLGPRAHNDFVKITRVGIGDWSKAKLLNEKLLESYQKMVKWTTEAIEQKKWELEQVQCQISFLSIGATFEDAKAPEQE